MTHVDLDDADLAERVRLAFDTMVPRILADDAPRPAHSALRRRAAWVRPVVLVSGAAAVIAGLVVVGPRTSEQVDPAMLPPSSEVSAPASSAPPSVSDPTTVPPTSASPSSAVPPTDVVPAALSTEMTAVVANASNVNGAAGMLTVRLAGRVSTLPAANALARQDSSQILWAPGFESAAAEIAAIIAAELPTRPEPSTGPKPVDPVIEIATSEWADVDLVVLLGDDLAAEFGFPSVTAIGTSVMLGAAVQLEELGWTVYADVSKGPDWTEDVLRAVGASGNLGPIVVLEVGVNGPVTQEQLDAIVDAAKEFGAQRIVLVTVHVNRSWGEANNELFRTLDEERADVVLAEWDADVDAGRVPGLAGDGIHLSRVEARLTYADILARAAFGGSAD
jgi:energy-converting hydrogenase Eha subunit E